MVRVDAGDLEKVRRGIVLAEAAVEGADMGDRELQDAIACTLLDVLKMLQPMDTANIHRLEEAE